MYPYEKYVNLILFLVFLVSLLYLLYNLTFSEGSYKKLVAISESVKHLDYFLSIEKAKNQKLKQIWEKIRSNQNQTLEVWTKDFLFMVGKDEVIYLPQKDTENSTNFERDYLEHLIKEK
ncbi:MAG: hypothetical protein GXN97_00555 [Aquificae bacterium]|nr:hypothetical protein [Aquificota bacterium]